MHVIITMAGHSRRFKAAGYDLPKFLIEIDGKPMIEHVTDMFDATDHFYFVLNTEQVRDYPEIETLLKRSVRHCHITAIKPHELGPTHSALQVKDVPSDEEVIVTYCDFVVVWDYQQFKREVYGYDGAVPAFRGYHPASFGDTYYAYMWVNDQGEMLELREKQSFTPNRHEEPASAGIYYFRSFELFEKYGRYVSEHGFENLKEGYTSLLFNPMVSDGLKVQVPDVDKFICWGTPEDLEQYLFWSDYFNTPQTPPAKSNQIQKIINLMPMAGKGTRFKEAGYRVSKPLIQVQDKPMIIRACDSFPHADHWVFLPRLEHVEKHGIDKVLYRALPNSDIIAVDHETSGQAATCLLAEEKLDGDAALFIASCDYITRFDQEKWEAVLADETIDAAIWTYRLGSLLTKNPNAFAYCKVASDGHTVIEIVEKATISDNPSADPLVVGSFWFRRASGFIHCAKTAIEEDLNVNGEHYVATSMNLMLAQGKRIVIFDIDQWISFGDPFELRQFEYWEEYFNHDLAGGALANRRTA